MPMTLVSQSPKSIARYVLTINETTILMKAAAATELPPVPAPELAIREKGRLIPIASLVRVMRRVLPPQAKVSDDSKELMQECVSEFISFVTGEANEWCQGDHRTTVTGEDVIWAMVRLGFDDYVTALRAYVRRMLEGAVVTAPSWRASRNTHRRHPCRRRPRSTGWEGRRSLARSRTPLWRLTGT
jgi:nuclear transcription Y subunit beta